MPQRPEAGGSGVNVVEGALEEIVQIGIRVLRFHSHFQKLAAIGGEQGGGVAAAKAFSPVTDGDFAEGVEVAAAGLDDGNLATEKEIELAGEGAFRAAGTFCDGFDEAVVFGEPVDDEAGIRQAGETDDDGLGGLHGSENRDSGNFCDGNREE